MSRVRHERQYSKKRKNDSIEIPKKILDNLANKAKRERRSVGTEILVMLEKILPEDSTEKDETITKMNIPLFIEKSTLEKLDIIGHNEGISRSQVVARFIKKNYATSNE